MKIKIPRLSFYEIIIFLILFIILFSGTASIFFPNISIIKYGIDILLSILLISFIKNYSAFKPKDKYLKKILIWITMFFFVTIVTSLFRIESFTLFIWSIRSYIRYIVFFMACFIYLKKDYTKFLNIIYCINFILVLVEFFILGKKQDWIGGIFGTTGGAANAPLNLLLIISTVIFTILYLNKKIKMPYFLITCISSIIIAALAELKFFYLEFIIIIILAFLLSEFSVRKLKILIIAVIVALLGINILYVVFPGLDKRFYSYDFIYNTYTSNQGYTSSNDINRLNFIDVSNKFLNSSFDKTFGLGLGNCDVISFLNVSSNFYRNYNYLHYTWLSSSFIYLEAGFVGFALYIGFFIYYAIILHRYRKEGNNNIICQISEVLSLMIPFIILYNLSMRSDEAFFVFFVLALPFVSKNHYNVGKKGDYNA